MNGLSYLRPTRLCSGAAFSPDIGGSSTKVKVGRVSLSQELCFGACQHPCGGLRSQSSAIGVRRGYQCRALVEERKCTGANYAPSAQEYFSQDEDMTFLQRLARAWQILFPTRQKISSNAAIAKQRLKMILISDRCSVNDEAKRRIVTNIVGALADFVEIESEEKVQLNVSTDPDLGTVYSVTIPVRRVKPEYQEYSREMRDFEGIQYDDSNVFGEMRTLDIKFENMDSSEAESD